MRRLAFVPFALAAVVAMGLLLPRAPRGVFFTWTPVVVTFATAVAAAAAAARFVPSDRLFAPWAGLSLGHLLITVNYVLRALHPWPALNNSITVAINTIVPLSLWLFVRAWMLAGIRAPLSRAGELASRLAGFAVALLVGGYPLMRAWSGAHADVYLLVSSVGDIVGFALLVPLAMPVLAMRGGVLMYTWLYLACSQIGWMAYDIFLAVAPSLGMEPPDVSQARQIPRTIAVVFVLIAAAAQRMAMLPRRAEFDPDATATAMYLREPASR